MTSLHGSQNTIPRLERALNGRSIGDEFEITVAPDDAYGQQHEGIAQQVPREAFENFGEIGLGMRVAAQTELGPADLVVTEVSDDLVTVDVNQPLAEPTLIFSTSVIDIRAASEEEILHSHIHGSGGREHWPGSIKFPLSGLQQINRNSD